MQRDMCYIISKKGVLICTLFFATIQLSSQINLVVNPGFEEYDYFQTELKSLPLSAAVGWKSFRTADLYLRKGLDEHENIVRMAPYLNECIIASLKYPTQKNIAYKFSMDVFSFKKRRHENLFQLCFIKNGELAYRDPEFFQNCLSIPAKRIKKGWQTLKLDFYAPEGISKILIGNIKTLEDDFLLYLDNVKIMAPVEKREGTMQINSGLK